MTELKDDFKGDTQHLIRCIEALLSLDADGALVPHGIGGHARDLLAASAVRLSEIADDASYELGRLLNHIHGDHGQHLAVHGWKTAATDALAKLTAAGETNGKRSTSAATASGHELPDAGESRTTAIVGPEGATDAVANGGDARVASAGSPSGVPPSDGWQRNGL